LRPQKSSTVTTVLQVAAFAFFLGGIVLELTIGSRFIFYFAGQYSDIGLWAFLLLLPAFGIQVFRHLQQAGRRTYPTWAVRWLIMFPLATTVGAAVLVIAPLGWIATFVWATGTTVEPSRGQLVSVDDFRSSGRGCNQRGRLEVQQHQAAVCLEGIAALPMKSGSVIIRGKSSRLGLLVERVVAE
jgi:hypothetical protein